MFRDVNAQIHVREAVATNGEAEELGREIEQGLDATGEAVEKGVEATADAVNKVGRAVRDAVTDRDKNSDKDGR